MAQGGLDARDRSRSPGRTTVCTIIEKVTALCKALENSVEMALEKADGRPQDVVVVLDLDETCFTAATDNALATSAWFENVMERWPPILQAETGMSRPEVLMECLALVDCFYPLVAAKLTEEALPELLQKYKANGIATIGLTARRPDLAPVTWHQLGEGCALIFDSLSPPLDAASVKTLENHLRMNGHAAPDNPDAWEGIRQDRGVWFTANANKGALLRQVLKTGSHVVFADDSERHLHDVRAALDGHAASVRLLHYTAAKDAAQARLNIDSCDLALAGHCATLFEKENSGFMDLVQSKQKFLKAFVSSQLEHLDAQQKPINPSLISLARSLL